MLEGGTMDDIIIENLDDVYNIVNVIIPKLFFKVEIESDTVFVYVPKPLVEQVALKLRNMFSHIYISTSTHLATAFIQVIGE